MKKVWLIPVVCTVSLAAANELKVEPSSRFNSAMTVTNRLGEVIVPTRYLLAKKQLANGTTHRLCRRSPHNPFSCARKLRQSPR